jgi:hypothetical protein
VESLVQCRIRGAHFCVFPFSTPLFTQADNHNKNGVNREQGIHQTRGHGAKLVIELETGLPAFAIDDIQEQCLDVAYPAVWLFPAILHNPAGDGHYREWWSRCGHTTIFPAPFHVAAPPGFFFIIS